MLAATWITAAIAAVSLIILLRRLFKGGARGTAFFCFAGVIPMCWVMYYGVRLPSDRWLLSLLGEGETLFWIRSAYAPLTEEPAKLWPLLLPFVRISISKRNLAGFALALGGGFAVGEVFTVAGIITTTSPDVASLPWYALTGFMGERLMTCVIHSAMTATALVALQRGYGFLVGLFAAMGLHYLVNLPISLGKLGWLGSDVTQAQIVLSLWVVFCAVLGLVMLLRISDSDRSAGTLVYGEAICPSCQARYSRSLLKGLNFGFSLRYEPCPECHRWHCTRRFDKRDE